MWAFGPENIGVPTVKSGSAWTMALRAVGVNKVQHTFTKQALRRTEAACGNRGSCGNGAKMHSI